MSRTFFLCKTKTVIRYDCLTVWKQSVFVPAGLKIRPEWFFTAFGNGFLWHWFFRFRTKKTLRSGTRYLWQPDMVLPKSRSKRVLLEWPTTETGPMSFLCDGSFYTGCLNLQCLSIFWSKSTFNHFWYLLNSLTTMVADMRPHKNRASC